MPNILTQMLLRGANGVGYTNYPDNVVQAFVQQAADSGVDVFRVFDSLNWVENMRVAMDAVIEAGKVCEGTICYTGDILDPDRAKYDLKYYVGMAKELEAAGAHILGLKDMAGPAETGRRARAGQGAEGRGRPADPLPHPRHRRASPAAPSWPPPRRASTRSTAAMDSLSRQHQPGRRSARSSRRWRHTDRDTGLDIDAIREMSNYWEAVRGQYAAFESGLQAPASEVYLHEMPGGQFTNLKAQARSLGLEERWHEVAQIYADVNQMFGDIVKVTPSSKVVGDMALMMVSQGLTRAQVEDPDVDVSFPDSVIDMMKGNLGQPPGGFPEGIVKKVLKGEKPLTERPGKNRPPARSGGGPRRGGQGHRRARSTTRI